MFKKITSVLKVFTRPCSICFNPTPPHENPCMWTLLPNGTRVISETTCSPLVCASMFVEAGPRYETACNNGITHFIEHFAYKGFRSLLRSEFETQALRQGMQFRAYTTREYQVFYVVCTTDCIGVAIGFLSKIIYDLDINEYDIEKERSIIEMELTDADKDPRLIMFDYLHQSAFQNTPLAQRVIGPSCNIQKFDRTFTRLFINEQYQPYRLVLSISGGVSHEDAVCCVQDCFGALEPAPCALEFWPCRYTGSSIHYRDDSKKFLYCAIGFEVPGYGSQEYLQLQVFKSMLGRWDMTIDGGNKSWPLLARASSVAQLSVKYEPFYFAYRDVGLWGVYFVTKADETEDMIYNITDTFMKFCTIINEADANRAKSLYKTDYARNVEGIIRSSLDMGEQMLFTCTRRSLSETFDLIDAMKSMEMKNLANKYLYDKCPVVIGVGPTEAIPEYNRIRAGMYWLRL